MNFEPIYPQFKNKPKEAIRHLLKMQTGVCLEALYREEIGYIDIVWGENDENHRGYGLKHIIEKHRHEIMQLGLSVEDFIPLVVQFGACNEKKSDTHKKVYESDTFRFIIAIDRTNNRNWLLTAFDLRKKPGM
jgi:hypothetical protein